MNSWIKAAAVAAAVVATPIIAQETLGSSGGPPPGRGGGGLGKMRMADANGDGVVTRDEYLAAVDARFARMDRNGDGVLDESERPGRRGPPPGADGESPPPGPRGKMTREQFRAEAMRRFDRLDTNHDGKIDANEMAAAATLMRARRAGGGERGEAAPPPPPPPGE